MKYVAVIFDLWGTLVPGPSNHEYMVVLERMASSLSVPLDDFNRVWFETASQRNMGIIQSIETNIEHICKELGARAGDAEVRQATRIRLDSVTQAMRPRPDAVEVLSKLKEYGYKTGLISDCSHEMPTIWKGLPLASLIDITAFSCLLGITKPDPRIYQLVTDQLEVQPEDCLYVGDGSSQELAGAARVGMSPVLIRVPGDGDYDDVYRINPEEWNGPRVSSLSEVLKLLE